MKSEYFLLIILCSILTSGPKIITLKFLKGKNIRREIIEFLNIIPFTSLAILITRSILTLNGEIMIPTIISLIICGVVAYFRNSITETILAGVGTMFILIQVLVI